MPASQSLYSLITLGDTLDFNTTSGFDLVSVLTGSDHFDFDWNTGPAAHNGTEFRENPADPTVGFQATNGTEYREEPDPSVGFHDTNGAEFREEPDPAVGFQDVRPACTDFPLPLFA